MPDFSKDKRPWVKVTTEYFRNPKVMKISDSAKLLHLQLIAWAGDQKTDGVVPTSACKQRGPKAFRELVEHGFLEPREGDYLIHDYLQHQTPAKTINEKATMAAHVRWHVKRSKVDPECTWCAKQEDGGSHGI